MRCSPGLLVCLLPLVLRAAIGSPLRTQGVSRVVAAGKAQGSSSNQSQAVVAAAADSDARPVPLRRSLASKCLSAWGVLFVLSLLANAIKRLAPIALQPLNNQDLTHTQTALYVTWCLLMSYVEGYKAFHLKFVPLVVRRSLTLIDNPSFLNYLLAGPYSMGLFYGTKRRKITSWCVTTGVFALVMLVKRLSYPWRSIIDAGVVCGLSVGALSLTFQFIKGVFGIVPDIDPCLPNTDEDSKANHLKTK